MVGVVPKVVDPGVMREGAVAATGAAVSTRRDAHGDATASAGTTKGLFIVDPGVMSEGAPTDTGAVVSTRSDAALVVVAGGGIVGGSLCSASRCRNRSLLGKLVLSRSI